MPSPLAIPKVTLHTKIAGGVVLSSSGDVLIVNQNGNSWSLPKGHIESGESAEQAARREIAEESGVTELDFVGTLGSYERYKISLDGGDDMSEKKHLQFFLYKTTQTDLEPRDPSNPEAKWLSIEKIADSLTHPEDRKFFINKIPQVRDALSSQATK